MGKKADCIALTSARISEIFDSHWGAQLREGDDTGAIAREDITKFFNEVVKDIKEAGGDVTEAGVMDDVVNEAYSMFAQKEYDFFLQIMERRAGAKRFQKFTAYAQDVLKQDDLTPTQRNEVVRRYANVLGRVSEKSPETVPGFANLDESIHGETNRLLNRARGQMMEAAKLNGVRFWHAMRPGSDIKKGIFLAMGDQDITHLKLPEPHRQFAEDVAALWSEILEELNQRRRDLGIPVGSIDGFTLRLYDTAKVLGQREKLLAKASRLDPHYHPDPEVTLAQMYKSMTSGTVKTGQNIGESSRATRTLHWLTPEDDFNFQLEFGMFEGDVMQLMESKVASLVRGIHLFDVLGNDPKGNYTEVLNGFRKTFRTEVQKKGGKFSKEDKEFLELIDQAQANADFFFSSPFITESKFINTHHLTSALSQATAGYLLGGASTHALTTELAATAWGYAGARGKRFTWGADFTRDVATQFAPFLRVISGSSQAEREKFVKKLSGGYLFHAALSLNQAMQYSGATKHMKATPQTSEVARQAAKITGAVEKTGRAYADLIFHTSLLHHGTLANRKVMLLGVAQGMYESVKKHGGEIPTTQSPKGFRTLIESLEDSGVTQEMWDLVPRYVDETAEFVDIERMIQENPQYAQVWSGFADRVEHAFAVRPDLPTRRVLTSKTGVEVMDDQVSMHIQMLQTPWTHARKLYGRAMRRGYGPAVGVFVAMTGAALFRQKMIQSVQEQSFEPMTYLTQDDIMMSISEAIAHPIASAAATGTGYGVSTYRYGQGVKFGFLEALGEGAALSLGSLAGAPAVQFVGDVGQLTSNLEKDLRLTGGGTVISTPGLLEFGVDILPDWLKYTIMNVGKQGLLGLQEEFAILDAKQTAKTIQSGLREKGLRNEYVLWEKE